MKQRPTRGAARLGVVREIGYTHDNDHHDYKHDFETEAVIELLPDGSVRIYSPEGHPLWKEV